MSPESAAPWRRDERWSGGRRLPLPFIFLISIVSHLILGPDLTLAQSASGTIGGRVSSASGEPVPAAEVVVSGTSHRAVTDRSGEFLLTGLSAGGWEIRVNALGYRELIDTVQVSAGQSTVLSLELRAAAFVLDGVVVTGQATGGARREVGSAVGVIDAGSLEAAPVRSMSDLLQARVPGLHILPGGGKSGQSSRILLRGASSLTQSNEPLIYLDGVRIDNSSISGISTTTAGVAWSGLDDLDPEDIDRIEVVRGAAAATLYGTEASAGVIQIFTRSGAVGLPAWRYSGEVGLLQTPLSWWDISEYSPWYHRRMVRRGGTTSHQLSFRGGVEGVDYYLAASRLSEEGVLLNDGQDRYSFRTNLGISPRSDLRIRFSGSFTTRSTQQVPDANNTRGYSLNGLVGGPSGQFVPTESLTAQQGFQDGTRLLGGITLEHRPPGPFMHRLSLGGDLWNQDHYQIIPYGAIENIPEGYRTNYRRESRGLTLDYLARARFQLLPDLRYTTAIGFQYHSQQTGVLDATGEDFPFFGLETVSATLRTTAGEGRLEERTAGVYLEEHLAYREYLFLTVGARADGHSAFGRDVAYQVYPRASLSYLATQHLSLPGPIGELRLRSAYGAAGQQPASFSAVRSWRPAPALGARPAVVPANLGNPGLRPEVTHELELGLDLIGLDNRLSLELTHYRQSTHDALYPVGEPPSRGVLAPQLRNVGEVMNRGWEVGVRGSLVDRQTFRWSALANLSTNRNEVVSLGAGAPIQVQWLQWLREGYPIGSFFGDRPLERGGQVGMASDLLRDEAGNLPEGWDYIGPPLPTRTIQIGSTLEIGERTTLNLLFDHRGGAYAQSNTMRWLMQPNRDITQTALDSHAALGYPDLAEPGPVARVCRNPDPVQAITCSRNSSLTDGDFAMPTDFWKLRELSLSYRLPERWVARVGLGAASLDLAGRNLWRRTVYPGLEPEGMYIGDQPNSAIRSQTFFDTPIPRHFTIGLRAEF